MDGFEQLNAFYEAIEEDSRIGAFHISLYISLLRYRSKAAWPTSIIINRYEIMQESRMGRKTFNKYMKDLTSFGFIKYEPSTSPKGGSRVYFNKL